MEKQTNGRSKKKSEKESFAYYFFSYEELVYAGLDKCLVEANLIP